MHKTHLSSTCLFLLLTMFSFAAQAQDDGSGEDTISVYATACESLRSGEAKSGARVRATDKAAFKAVEHISALSDIRAQAQPHDFNVLVYSLVDNHLEDMAVRTLEKNDEQICVEVTGYLSPQNIAKVSNEHETSKQTVSSKDDADIIEEDELTLELESDPESLPEPVSEFPPKPQPKIHQEIAYETTSAKQNQSLSEDNKIIVFVERTKFYNGSETGGFYPDIRQALSENANIKTVTSKTDADYIINTNVLRAKVDPINKQTNRLQMVVQLELIDTAKGTSIIEHQNRFILFQSDDDEQKVAASLMKKLLAKGCKQLLPKIKDNHFSTIGTESIITPSRLQNTEN